MRAAWLLVIVAACGFPPLPGQPGDQDGPPPDGGTGGCPAPQTYGRPTVSGAEGFFVPAATQTDPDLIEWDGQISERDLLFVYLFAPGPQFPNGFVPKTITLAGDETNFSTCSGCVLIGASCQGCAPEVNNNGKYFMATGGTLQITQISTTKVTGKLTNVTFAHVLIQNQGTNPSLLSTPAGDGCATRVDALDFTATLAQP